MTLPTTTTAEHLEQVRGLSDETKRRWAALDLLKAEQARGEVESAVAICVEFFPEFGDEDDARRLIAPNPTQRNSGG